MMKRHLITYILILLGFCSCGQTSRTIKKVESVPVDKELTAGRDTFNYFSIIDTNYSKYKLPETFHKPKKWLKAEEERKGMSGDWYGGSYADTFDLKDALALIDTTTNLSLGAAKSWCINNYKQAFPYLIARLSDKRNIGLKNTADLIIWDRVGTGDLKFYGHGGCITEDIFTVAGRASWILNKLTGENFAEVHGNLSQQDAEKFKKLWAEYISRLK